MRISQAGIDLIKQCEGVRLHVYKDAVGKATIGVGHLIRPGESFTTITEAEAEDLLRQDVSAAERAISGLVKVGLSQNQFDALVCFVFNVGANAFKNSTMLRMLNERQYAGAAAQFGRWTKAGGREFEGLVTRRAAERELFLTQ